MTLLISGQAYNDPVLYGIPKSTIAIDRKDGIYCANHGVPDLVANVVYASTALVDNVIYFMGGKKNYVEGT